MRVGRIRYRLIRNIYYKTAPDNPFIMQRSACHYGFLCWFRRYILKRYAQVLMHKSPASTAR